MSAKVVAMVTMLINRKYIPTSLGAIRRAMMAFIVSPVAPRTILPPIAQVLPDTRRRCKPLSGVLMVIVGRAL
jgi:hypothetical protein